MSEFNKIILCSPDWETLAIYFDSTHSIDSVLNLCRTVYGTERICHTCDIFGPNMSHVWYIRSNTAHPPAEYGTQNVSYSAGFNFSMLTKTYLSLTKNAHKNEKSNVYVTCARLFLKIKSSSWAHYNPKTLTFIITFLLFWCIVFILGYNNAWDRTFKYTVLNT